MSLKNTNETIGNRNRDLPVCSVVHICTCIRTYIHTYMRTYVQLHVLESVGNLIVAQLIKFSAFYETQRITAIWEKQPTAPIPSLMNLVYTPPPYSYKTLPPRARCSMLSLCFRHSHFSCLPNMSQYSPISSFVIS